MTQQPISISLSQREVSGPIGKTISRCGADASVAYSSNGDALDHLTMAEQIDARGDALLRLVARLIGDARRAPTDAQRESLLRVASERLNQAMDLDAVEQEHWAVFATERIVTAREACFRVVQTSERALGHSDAGEAA
jgi:hypothetical protein